MNIETFNKIKKLKSDLVTKLKSEPDKKSLTWFWENKIMVTELTKGSFMGSLNCNGGDLRGDVEEIINNYLNEKF